jgi:HK97 gp10 family phage protein
METIRFYPDALAQLLESTSGPVAKDLLRRTIKVESAAKRLCPVDTGRLRSSITHSVERDAKGLAGIVGTDVEYGIHVELGTRRSRPQPYLRPALKAAT